MENNYNFYFLIIMVSLSCFVSFASEQSDGSYKIPTTNSTENYASPESNEEKDMHFINETLLLHHSTISVPGKNSCPSFKEDMDGLNQEQFLTLLMQGCRYDKVTKPDSEGALNITVQMGIKHIEASEHQQFRMNMVLNFRYIDSRLKYDGISPNRGLIVGDNSIRTKLWTPHILLLNERQSTLIGLEGKDTFITISPMGVVTFSCRMNAIIYCWMNLKKFPFDKQKCTMSFRSWTYNSSNVHLQWDNNNPVLVDNELHLTQFSLVHYFTSSQIVEELSFDIAGNYSMITFEFLLSREIGYYMLDYFIPSCLLVAATWGTFWLQADNTPARTTLGTSPMLAFITLAQGQNRALPKVSYVKASDIWFLMCAIFIFASMAEFFFVNVIWRRKKQVDLKKVNSKYILKSTLTPRLAKREMEMANVVSNRQTNKETVALYATYLTVGDMPETHSSPPSQSSQTEDDIDQQLSIPIPTVDYEQEQSAQPQQWTTMTPQEVSIWIDKRSRIAFPCAFLVCNILYWSFVYVF